MHTLVCLDTSLTRKKVNKKNQKKTKKTKKIKKKKKTFSVLSFLYNCSSLPSLPFFLYYHSFFFLINSSCFFFILFFPSFPSSLFPFYCLSLAHYTLFVPFAPHRIVIPLFIFIFFFHSSISHVSHLSLRLSRMNTLSHQPHSLARTNTVSRQKKSKHSLSHSLDKALRQFSNSFAIAVVEQWDDEFDFLPSDTVLKIPDEINASTLKVNKDLNLIRQFSDFSKGKPKTTTWLFLLPLLTSFRHSESHSFNSWQVRHWAHPRLQTNTRSCLHHYPFGRQQVRPVFHQ